MNDDATLLRRYVSEGSQPAFTELVQRYVDLVYGAAMRRTGGDATCAAEVAQDVFTSLAKNARKLSVHTVLPAWLHTATRNAALNLMIAERRRRIRETEALAMEKLTPENAGTAPDWERLKPLLDSAIDELAEADRAAIVLRFLQKQPFADIGRAAQISEDAARMRTDRALEKLRSVLARRGITSTATALGAAVMGQPLISAPLGLAGALAAQALIASSAGFFVTLSSFMTTKIITMALLSALVAFVAGTYAGHKTDAGKSPAPAAPVVPDQSQLVASLREDNRRLTGQLSDLDAEVVRLNGVNTALTKKQTALPVAAATPAKSPNIGLPRYELQRAVLNNLRQIDSARAQFALENGHPAHSVQELVGINHYIKTVRTVGGEDYSNVSMADGQPLTVTTPDGVTVTYDPSGTQTTQLDIPPEVAKVQELGKKVEPSARKAIEGYRAAHGSNPPNEEAILPFFGSPQEGADYVEFMTARKSAGL